MTQEKPQADVRWFKDRAKELKLPWGKLSVKITGHKDQLRKCLNGKRILKLSEAVALAKELRVTPNLVLTKMGHKIPSAVETYWGSDFYESV